MKFFILTIALLTASSALACPNLSGTFFCKDEMFGEEDTFSITSTEEDGITTYAFGKDGDVLNYITDGKLRPMFPDEPDEPDAYYTASCIENRLRVYVTGEEFDGVETEMLYSMDGSDLVQQSNVKFPGQTLTQTITCKAL